MVTKTAPWISRPALLGAGAGTVAGSLVAGSLAAGFAVRVAAFAVLVATGCLAGFAVSARRRIGESAAAITRLRLALRASQDHIMEHGSSRSLAAWIAGAGGPIRDTIGVIGREARALAAETGLPDTARAAAARLAERVAALETTCAPLAGYALPERSRAPFDINVLVREALELCRQRAGEKKIRFEERLGALPPVFGPATRVQGALLNVIVNAVEAMPFGGGVIQVETAHEDHRVVARVRDGGIGIRPEHLARVTEPFFTTKPEKSGAGLGLWETRDTVEGIGGSLAIRSVPHQGTEVTLSFPEAAPLSQGRAGVPHPEEVARNTADEGDRRIA